MNNPSLAYLCKKRIFLDAGLVAIFVASILLASCGDDWGKSAGEKAARIISEEVIPDLTNEFAQWRGLADEALEELPEEFRHQFDLAFSRAIDAAGAEFRCDTDFVRQRLVEDLLSLRASALGQAPPAKTIRICNIWPEAVIELDQDLQPQDKTYLRFGGYNFDDPNVRVLLEYKDGDTDDLTSCCLDNPTHYLLTIDLDEITFTPEHRRIILGGTERQSNSVAINQPPPVKKVFTYKIDLTTGSADYASAGDDSEVWIKIYGTKGTAGETNVVGNFERNRTESRVFTVDDLGDIQYVHVRYIDRNNNAWLLDSIAITNVTNNEVIWTNRCNKNFGHQNPNENTCP